MPIKRAKTEIHPSVTRFTAYHRRKNGHHLTFTDWVALKRRQFERLFPHFAKQSGQNRIEFDRWLEKS